MGEPKRTDSIKIPSAKEALEQWESSLDYAVTQIEIKTQLLESSSSSGLRYKIKREARVLVDNVIAIGALKGR